MPKKIEFNIKELVLLGVLNAVLLALYYAVIALLHFIPPLWAMMDPIANFLLVPVYVLMLRLIPKPPVMTIHGTLMGFFHMMAGWWPGMIAGLVGGVLADVAVMLAGGYLMRHSVTLAVLVFTTTKTFLFYSPLYMVLQFPILQDVVSRWPKEAVEGYTMTFSAIVLAINLVACLIGLQLGQRMLTHHFNRSGVVEM